ncbi:MAG: type II secretion system F family protein [Tissierellia bacterium]|nr:type II secretion system F family protein [Tissierellia bacterium]
MIYGYKAFKNQEIVVGKLEGDSQEEVIARLKERGLRPIRVWEDISQTHALKRRITFHNKELSMIFYQLSLLVHGGILIDKSIEIIGDHFQGKKKTVFRKIHSNLLKGDGLSQSFQKSDAFTPFVCNMIQVGENSSQLGKVFQQLSSFYKKEEEMKQKIYKAMTYPIILLTVTLGILNFLMVYVVPRFQILFEESEKLLPLPTRILLKISYFLKQYYGWFLGTILIMIGILSYIFYKNPKRYHELWLKNRLYRQLQIIRFNFSLWILLSSGLRLEKGIELIVEMEKNTALKDKYGKIPQLLQSGYTLSQSLEKCDLFPKLMISMVHIGEETSRLDQVFETIYYYYDQEFNRFNERFATLLEPLLILILAFIVGFIVLAVALPIFDLVNRI